MGRRLGMRCTWALHRRILEMCLVVRVLEFGVLDGEGGGVYSWEGRIGTLDANV